MENASEEFSFPKPQVPKQLTASSTVVHATSKPPADASGAQPAASTSAPVPVAQAAAEKAGRKKVPLEKGYSQVDWLRTTKTAEGPGVRSEGISMEEVAQHKSKEDAWLVLNGKVYCISPYLRFHPGGPSILLKAAGRDATSLFMKYHPWVNGHALLAKFYLGPLLPADPSADASASAPGGKAKRRGSDGDKGGTCRQS